jgi:hypothetical protein
MNKIANLEIAKVVFISLQLVFCISWNIEKNQIAHYSTMAGQRVVSEVLPVSGKWMKIDGPGNCNKSPHQN